MYIPKHFEITNEDEKFAFIESNAFGQLISTVEGRPFATHMPFYVSDDRSKLIGHFAKQNPQHGELANQEVLVTLQGPHDYISPSWYEAPGVPTWNFQAVHVYGQCAVFDDIEWLKDVVDTLTAKFESSFESPWQPEYAAARLGAIIGIEITITEIQCKYKLNQNRSSKDRGNVIEQLEKQGSHKLSKAMLRNEQ